jgi:hypothetical protein
MDKMFMRRHGSVQFRPQEEDVMLPGWERGEKAVCSRAGKT